MHGFGSWTGLSRLGFRRRQKASGSHARLAGHLGKQQSLKRQALLNRASAGLRFEPLEDRHLLATVSVNDAQVQEPAAGNTVNMTFTISLQQAQAGVPVSVRFFSENMTATAPADYTAVNDTWQITPPANGDFFQQVNVTVKGDNLVEGNEQFRLRLDPATIVGATIADGEGIGTITEAAAGPTISIGDVTAAEGNTGNAPATQFKFTVGLSQAITNGQAVTVKYKTRAGTATENADYAQVLPTQITFLPGGALQQQVTVNVTGDQVDEPDETFFVDLLEPNNATIADGVGLGTIQDDDVAAPTLFVSDVTKLEGNTGNNPATQFKFTVGLTAPINNGQPVKVTVSTANGTATAGADYQALAPQELTFNPGGPLTQEVTVLVTGDALDELDEDFFVNLANPVNAVISDNQGVGTIVDDDGPLITINDVLVSEADANANGQMPMVFKVTLSAASPQPIRVAYSTANNTATAGQDYQARNGFVVFQPGQLQRNIIITGLDDLVEEAPFEDFFVNLALADDSLNRATIVDNRGVGTIADNDQALLSINDVSTVEGNAGQHNVAFTVSVNIPSEVPITFSYQTQNGSATAGADYVAVPPTVVTLPAGQLTTQVIVAVKGDLLDEPNETFFVQLSADTVAEIDPARRTGQGLIIDDDGPALSVNDVTVNEANTAVSFTISLNGTSPQQVSVDFTTSDGSATAGADYESTGGNVVFQPGETAKTVTVNILDDDLDEVDETFLVVLTNAVNAGIADNQGVGTILDNDESPKVSITGTQDLEGHVGTKPFIFAVQLTKESGKEVSVNYRTVDGTAKVSTNDYIGKTGTVTFAPGETSKQVQVLVVGDRLFEPNEDFLVQLFNPVDVMIDETGQQATGTIINDDKVFGEIAKKPDEPHAIEGEDYLLTGAVKDRIQLAPGLELLHNSLTFPHPIINVETVLTTESLVPTSIQAKLTLTNLVTRQVVGPTVKNYTDTANLRPGDALRFSVQTDGLISQLRTGAYEWKMEIIGSFSEPVGGEFSNRTYDNYETYALLGGSKFELVTNHTEANTPKDNFFGEGWWLSGLDRLFIPSNSPDRGYYRADGAAHWWEFKNGKFTRPEGADDDASLVFDSQKQEYTLATRYGERRVFDLSGKLIKLIDRNGNATLYGYLPNGRLDTIRDAFGRGTRLAYNAQGYLSSVTDFAGRITQLQIQNGQLLQVQSPDPDSAGNITIGGYNRGSAVMFLKNSHAGGLADNAFVYGNGSNNLVPLSGDWDGDGDDTAGLYNRSTGVFHLRNTNDTGEGDINIVFGPGGPDWQPLVGDWNADGIDTVGIYNQRLGLYFLRNSHTTGNADESVLFGPGNAGWQALAGDWNADGQDTIGAYNPALGVFYLRQTNTTGVADLTFAFGAGNAGWVPLVGDWNADGVDTIGAYTPQGSVYFLRNQNSQGFADHALTFGPGGANWLPVVGDWDGEQVITTFAYLNDPARLTRHGQLIRRVDPDPDAAGPAVAAETTWEYDIFGRLDKQKDPNPNGTATPAITELDSMQAVAALTVNPVGNLPRRGVEINPLGRVTHYHTDRYGNLTSWTEQGGQGKRLLHARDAEGWMTSSLVADDGDGLRDLQTLYENDLQGNVLKKTQVVAAPGGNDDAVWQWEYGDFSQVKREVNPAGRVTVYTLDATTGNVLSRLRPGDTSTTEDDESYTYAYTPKPAAVGDLPGGLLTRETGPNGLATLHDYYTDGQQLNRFGQRRRTQHPATSTPTGGTEVATMDFDYDRFGNLSQQLLSPLAAGTRKTQYRYDRADHQTHTLYGAQLGSIPSTRPAEFERTVYDLAGRQIATFETDGTPTRYEVGTAGQVLSITRAAGFSEESTERYTYDALGRKVRYIQELGAGQGEHRVTTYQYDDLTRSVTVTFPDPDSNGPALAPVYVYEYTLADQLKRLTEADPDGAGPAQRPITDYRYDALNRLIEKKEPQVLVAGSLIRPITTYTYFLDGQLRDTTDPLGRVTSQAYDAHGRLRSVTLPDPDGDPNSGDPTPVEIYAYDKSSNLVRVTNALGNVTTYTYDARNRRTKEEQPDPNPADNVPAPFTAYAYNAANELISQTLLAADGQSPTATRTTIWEYDHRGRVTRKALPDPFTGRPDTGLAPQYTYTYDVAGNLATVTSPANQLLKNAAQYRYDRLHRVMQIIEPDPDLLAGPPATNGPLTGGQWRYAYNDAGEITSVSDPLDPQGTNPTEYQYDALGRKVLERLPHPAGSGPNSDRPTTVYRYDGLDRLIVRQRILGTLDADPTQPVDDEVNIFEYDALDRLFREFAPGGAETRYAYDAVGNRVSQMDALGNATGYTYDALNRVKTTTLATGGTHAYQYDLVGNVIRHTDASGRARTFVYDKLGQRTQEVWRGQNDQPIRTLAYSFNTAGELLSVTDPDATLTYSYDSAGQQVSADTTGTPGVLPVLLSSKYDVGGHRTELLGLINPLAAGPQPLGFTNNYGYDALGRQTFVTQTATGGPAKRALLSYDPRGHLVGLDRGQDAANQGNYQQVAASTFTVDRLGRQTSAAHRKGSAQVVQQQTWVYSPLDRVTQYVSQDGTRNYSYDLAGRVTQVKGANNQVLETFTYDAVGNRTLTGYQTGPGNRLLSDGTFTYTYDGNGNVLTKTRSSNNEKTEFTWDWRNRLTQVITKSSQGAVLKSAQYVYDGLDRRIAENADPDGAGPTPASISRHIYDGDDLVLTLDAANAVTHRYLHADLVDVALADSLATGDTLWSLFDELQTVHDLIDGSGAVANHLQRSVFGKVQAEPHANVDHMGGFAGMNRDEQFQLEWKNGAVYDAATGRTLNPQAGLQVNPYLFLNNQPRGHVDNPAAAWTMVVSPTQSDDRGVRQSASQEHDGFIGPGLPKDKLLIWGGV